VPQILVIDDALLTREALAKLLEHEGYQASTASNGKDAWAMLYELTLRGQTPSLIILDLMMPQMDGVMFLKLLRRNEHWGQIPVMVLTGLDGEARLVQRARMLGVVEIIAKGDRGTDQLLQSIRRVLAPQAQTQSATIQRINAASPRRPSSASRPRKIEPADSCAAAV
jgi:CheY-like chemotaxis protein